MSRAIPSVIRWRWPPLAVSVAISAWLLTGCAAVRVEPGSGSQVAVEGQTYDQVWVATLQVVGKRLRIIAGTSKERGAIRAERAGGFMPGSETIGVFITPPGAPSQRYVIEVVSRKQGVARVIGRNWEPVLLEDLRQEFKLAAKPGSS